MLLFENPGTLDENALRLLGASVKEGPNPIGFYGTGTKYALALCFRLKIQSRIFSGVNEIALRTKEVIFRGQSFQEIIINGLSTSITTNVGPTWEPWMIVREFYSNALDEGGSAQEWDGPIEGKEGTVRVFLPTAWDSKDLYFKIPEPKENTVLPKVDEKIRLFRRGVLVYCKSEASLYDYAIDSKCRVTEERLLASGQEEEAALKCLNAADIDVKQHVLLNMKSFEKRLGCAWRKASPEWIVALDDRVIATAEQLAFFKEDLARLNPLILPSGWVEFLADAKTVDKVFRYQGTVKPRKEPLAKREEAHLEKALAILNRTGIKVTRYDIAIVEEFRDPFRLGHWDSATEMIVLKQSLLSAPLLELLSTLFHEAAHKYSEAMDCTREFEYWIGKQWAKLAMEKK